MRDYRSELMLKLLLAYLCRIDIRPMLSQQRAQIVAMCKALDAEVECSPDDVVALWSSEASNAALRFLDRLPEH